MRCNLIGLCGFALSLLSGILFLHTMHIEFFGFSFSSADSPLRKEVRYAVTNLMLVYFVGIGISFFTLRGALLLLPSLIVLLPMTWYIGFAYGVYVLAFLACFMLILSMFVGIEYPGRRLSIPPRSRTSWWHIRDDGTTSRPLSKSAMRAIALAIVGLVIILASFTFYVSSNDVSRLQVSVIVNGEIYGSVGFTVYLDGDAMYTGTMTYDGDDYVMQEIVNLDLSSGSHTLVLDAWNDSEDLPTGDVDSVAHVRTLPFSEDTADLRLGVYIA